MTTTGVATIVVVEVAAGVIALTIVGCCCFQRHLHCYWHSVVTMSNRIIKATAAAMLTGRMSRMSDEYPSFVVTVVFDYSDDAAALTTSSAIVEVAIGVFGGWCRSC